MQVESQASRSPRTVLVLLLALGVLAVAAWQALREERQAEAPSPNDVPASVTPSALRAAPGAPLVGRLEDGFVGPEACLACHEEEHASWHRSYHRTMTQVASGESVQADFDDVTLTNRGRTYRLRRSEAGFFVHMPAPEVDHGRAGAVRDGQPALVERRVVMVTGSHHMQVFWVEGPTPDREQFILPFAWLLPEKRWVPREDAFVVPPDAGFMHAMWNDNCIRCHATGAQPRRDPATGRFDTRVADLGISCEACHGPGREHVEFHRRPGGSEAPAHGITHPHALDTVRQAQVCGQCHAITGPPTRRADEQWFVDGYGYRAGDDLWATRGISRHPAKAAQRTPRSPPQNFGMPEEQLAYFFWPDGQVRVSGREYNGLLETSCYQRGDMTCLTCHALHDSDPNDQLRRDRSVEEGCLACHEDIAADPAAHTHHAPDSSGSRCMNCHMPHTTYGLYTAIRSHEIGSPRAAESLPPIARPNACNLCHLDRSLAWTAGHLQAWYGQEAPVIPEPHQRHAAGLVWLLQGDAGQRALLAWHFGWKDAQETAGHDWMAPALSVAAASDPYRAVRQVATRSMRRLEGFEDWSSDFLAPQAERTAAGKAAYARWRAQQPEGSRTEDPKRRVRLGLRPDGTSDLDLLMQLQRTRDNRPVFLGE